MDIITQIELGCLRAALVQTKARRKAARGYCLNHDMIVETSILDKEIDAMESRIGEIESTLVGQD